MGIDLKLAEKGVSVPRKGLLDEARRHQELHAATAEKLATAGWEDADTQAFESSLQEVESNHAAQVVAKTDTRAASKNEQASINRVKEVKRKLDLAVKDIFVDGKMTEEDRKVFFAGEIMGRSSTKLSKYVMTVEPIVLKYDPLLKKYFAGKSAHQELTEARKELDSSQAKQEFQIGAQPVETQKVYESMGRLLTLIEKMNRIGLIAFDGDAKMRAQFNKDLILRARSPRPSKDEKKEG